MSTAVVLAHGFAHILTIAIPALALAIWIERRHLR
jgi:hypothetical protein